MDVKFNGKLVRNSAFWSKNKGINDVDLNLANMLCRVFDCTF